MLTTEEPASFWAVLESVGTAAGAVFGFVTVLVTMYLLRQGQEDRRRLRQDENRRQASKVGIHTQTKYDPIPGQEHSYTVKGCGLQVLNESDQLIFVRGVRLVRNWSWVILKERGLAKQEVVTVSLGGPAVSSTLVRPGGSWAMTLPSGWALETGVGGDFAIVEFRDAESRSWQRRSDTLELRPTVSPLKRRQARFQALTQRAPLVHTLLMNPAIRLAEKATRRRQDRIPLSLRYLRFMWGYWGGGEEDSWTIPHGAPVLYRFNDLNMPTRPGT